ncbi:MAG: Asp-tRNA(Asn)/Glu-tRNA(Gln) amidotransferase subunit GatA, partial [Lentisphaeria bacterium]|nr:Asp-tRNA(Asn)/Glu-tRNA(Gln) amidotransferase subunit GatA [Lentisphaeria bacterium]
MTDFTVKGLAEQLAAGKITSTEIVKECLARVAARDGEVKAFLEINEANVLAAAAESDARRAAGNALSTYDGIPVGIKDCIAVKGERCSCASKLLEPVKSPFDSTAVARLKKAGFIPFGRLNMDEFAMGSSCENSAFQRTCNPLD